MLPDSFTVRDLEHVSLSTRSFEERLIRVASDASDGVQVYRTTSALLEGLGSTAVETSVISKTYAQLVSVWLRSLPSSVTGRSRLALEKLCRHVAASLYLASHALRRTHTTEQVSTWSSRSQDNAEEVIASRTTHDEDGEAGDWNASNLRAKKQSIAGVRAAVHHLNQFTTVGQMPEATSQAALKILSQWELGQNPRSHDYTEVLTELCGGYAVGGSALSSTDQERVDKQRGRRQKRLDERRSDEESQSRKRMKVEAQSAQEAHPPAWSRSAVVGGSQSLPGAAGPQDADSVDLLPETQAGIQGLTIASHIEPGKYGGRPFELRSRAKAARKAGF